MVQQRSRVLGRVGLAAVVLSTACARPPARMAPQRSAPRLVSRVVWPPLTAPPLARGADPLVDPVRITLRVAVDTAGRADLTTLSVVGRGALENRFNLAAWLAEAEFVPAERAGRRVRGTCWRWDGRWKKSRR